MTWIKHQKWTSSNKNYEDKNEGRFFFSFYRLFKLENTLQKDTKTGKFQEQLAEDSMMTNDSLVTDGSCYFSRLIASLQVPARAQQAQQAQACHVNVD